MKVAVIQPYFFPYLGYFALIQSADCFVLLDNVQYIRRGWINRNRILHPKNGWQYVGVPTRKQPLNTPIDKIQISNDQNWKHRILGQLSHYRSIAPYYDSVIDFLDGALDTGIDRLSALNYGLLKKTCDYLGIPINVLSSSELDADFSAVTHAGSWSLLIAEKIGATAYINPASGAHLYRKQEFEALGIELLFLQMKNVNYNQHKTPFEENLSIIDVLKFNSPDQTLELIGKHEIVHAT